MNIFAPNMVIKIVSLSTAKKLKMIYNVFVSIIYIVEFRRSLL